LKATARAELFRPSSGGPRAWAETAARTGARRTTCSYRQYCRWRDDRIRTTARAISRVGSQGATVGERDGRRIGVTDPFDLGIHLGPATRIFRDLVGRVASATLGTFGQRSFARRPPRPYSNPTCRGSSTPATLGVRRQVGNSRLSRYPVICYEGWLWGIARLRIPATECIQCRRRRRYHDRASGL